MTDTDAGRAPVAPKQKELSRVESVTSFNAWKDNFMYILAINKNFKSFLLPTTTWLKYSTANPNRGFTDGTGEGAVSKEDQAKYLDLFLGQIANYAPVISRNQITKNSTSLNDIWSKLREHYGIQTSGSKFIDITNIRLTPGERYEDLFQRILAFFEDNLLTTGCGLTHHGENVTTSEDLSPSLENMVVLVWLERIHIGLPGLVKQKYGAELRNRTLASIKSEISSALDSLLAELNSSEGGGNNLRVMRASSYNNSYNPSSSGRSRQASRPSNNQFCCLCHAAKRPNTSHWLSACPFLPEGDRRRFQQSTRGGGSRVRLVEVDDENDDGHDDGYHQELEDEAAATEDNRCFIDAPSVHRRVITRRSPHLKCFYNQEPVTVCLDTGSEANLVSHRFADDSCIPIRKASQGALQVDATTPLHIIGEINDVELTRGPHKFRLSALVTEQDIGDVIAGEPFLDINDIAVRPSKKHIIIQGRDIVPYANL